MRSAYLGAALIPPARRGYVSGMNTTFRFPEEVPGWLTETEGRALAEAAAGKRVLEVGSYLGRSTICLAQSAAHVTCVDPFDGRATDRPRDTFRGFLENLERYGVGPRVRPYRGPFDAVLPDLLAGAFDLVFIDADHDYDAVRGNIHAALPLLAAGGLLAFHDYRKFPGEHDGRWDEGVTQAVDELLAGGARLVSRAGTVAFVRPVTGPEAPRSEPLVALMQPSYARSVPNKQSAKAFYRSGQARRLELEMSTSLGIRCFNMLLCDVLNARRQHPLTHLAMIHDDICPDAGWLDTLLAELDSCGADMLSAVVPIKNPTGVTSTAVDMEGAPWVVRRLTMHEAFGLPETFTLNDIPWRLPGSRLLVNSGLWVCRLGDWTERVFPRDNPTGEARTAGLFFQDHARIVQLPGGEYVAEDISEDWDWSRQLDALGLTLAATRKVGLYHERPEFSNRHPWGVWETDQGYAKCQERLAATAAPAGV